MKKLFTLFAVLFFLSAKSGSAYSFVVSNSPDVNMDGVYTEAGVYFGKVYYSNSDASYGISWDGFMWEMGASSGGYIYSTACINPSSSATCPTSGWSCDGMVVAHAGDYLTYSGKRLIESIQNDGSLPGAVIITLGAVSGGQAFTGANGDDYAGNKIIFDTIPYGLTPHAVKTDNIITLTFTGAAPASSHEDEIYIPFHFTDAAFANGSAAAVEESADSLHLQYRNLWTVLLPGGDFNTIADAIAGSLDHDVISISGAEYTEPGLVVDKALTFIGQGADQTYIQADASPNTASDRVFTITATDTVEFRDLTIRNGNSSAGNGEGGAINSMTAPVNIVNCTITNNTATSSGSAYGGAIYCQTSLKITASLFSYNFAGSSTNCWGGAINCNQLYMVNTTMTGNQISAATTSYGSAIYAIHGPVEIMNCTIDGNTSSGGAALTIDDAHFNLTNSIVYGNTGGDDVETLNPIFFNAADCVIGASSTAAINGTNYNVSTLDPLLSGLTDNGGPTQTMAINTGSFAIDEGATGDSIPTTDQRGYGANGHRDIGAYEYGGLILATKPLTTDNAFAVYPNPANDFITVERATGLTSVYTITDLLGQTVSTGMLTAKNTVINVSKLASGVYIFNAGAQQYKLLKE